ncbi:3-deoxy-7-phosphoheptulonate synthase [Spirochaeta isovalerica]|uniref:Phospho-2-dehydro-3-deoxyheptonate aldolase n=1 Tax=Spirochaeta isovalerica TaxID=150 RepID=A0A841RFC4_9SPIO|nr:3-deoxy-7-phosphoheptulonate synthase [Spirochaeta isovalerica]MBB6481288.1 3-deoxy-7-phosphoheptulonate synthase [Spirochaeta isovalerica]
MDKLNNVNISEVQKLISPRQLKDLHPASEDMAEHIHRSRREISRILSGEDDRLLAIVGPCSIHDTSAAMEYAEKLNVLKKKYADKIYIMMRVYFEKPRTTIGWRGLIVDPHLDGTYQIGEGLKEARSLLLKINSIGLAAASEMLDPIVAQYLADLISWAAIGARTTESQTHREMTSGLSMPVGFKNGTDGSIQTAVDGMKSSRYPHSFIGIDQSGDTCIFTTKGNSDSHLILRGGRRGPNYYEESVEEAERIMKAAELKPAIVVDCSHSNSGKKHIRQERVLRDIVEQRLRGKKSIRGFMLESNLFEGNQKISENLCDLKYGVSITDECIGWKETEQLLASVVEKLD